MKHHPQYTSPQPQQQPTMPPTRRKPSAPHAQQTLAFGPRSNKVTKPSLPPSSKTLDKTSPPLPTKPLPTSQTRSPSPAASTAATALGESTTEIPNTDRGLAFRLQGQAQPDDVDERARKVPEKQIKTYWHAQEEERKAPRGSFSPSPFPSPPLTAIQCTNKASPSTRRSSATSTSPRSTGPASASRG